MSGEFQKRALALFRDGHRVVPIPKGEKGVKLENWTALADIQTEESVRDLVRTSNGSGVGILAKWTAGVDIDVRNFELAQKLAGLAHKHLGATVERIGQAPKLLLPYRVERPFPKVTSHSFRLPGDAQGDKPHKVEILADGQQWVAYHIHPDTGRPYHWPEGELPAREDLPELTEQSARLFIELAEAAIVAAGGRIEAGKLGSGGRGKTSGEGQAGAYEAIADALRHLPNRNYDYDEWVKIGLAIKGALGEAGRELWDGWSELSDKNDPEFTAKCWAGFKPQTIGAGTIYHFARAAGWKPAGDMALNARKAKQRRQKKPAPPEEKQEAAAPPPERASQDPGYICDKSGNAKDLIENAVIFLQTDERLKGRLRLNTLSCRPQVNGLPWGDGEGWRDWDDVDAIAFAAFAQRNGVLIKKSTAEDAVRYVASTRPHHPVKQYLEGLRWDGICRLDDWLHVYLQVPIMTPGSDPENAARNAYVRAVGAKALIGAVARVFEPGCKVDHMLILEGQQGAGKSTAVAILGGDWFTDQIADLHSKDASQDLRGKWLVEMSELSVLRGRELEKIKAYVTRSTDHYRASYGRETGDYPRQCVFIGTTNETQYLQDHTGNRRFWPVAVGRVDTTALRLDRDQLWAESVARYRTGEAWHLTGEALKAAEIEQESRVLSDSWEDAISEWASRQSRDTFSAHEVWTSAFGKPIAELTRAHETRIGAACHKLGMAKVRGKTDPATGKRPWLYQRSARR